MESNINPSQASPASPATHLDDGNKNPEMRSNGVTRLIGHRSDIISCAWNPASNTLASISTDSTARIWDLDSNNASNYTEIRSCNSENMEVGQIRTNSDILCMSWNCNGNYLATGSADGYVQIWNTDGSLANTLGQQKGPIHTIIKWNKDASRILTAGYDNIVRVWNERAYEYTTKEFCFHAKSVLDVSWKTNDIFASCSRDKRIYVCQLLRRKYVKVFAGHSEKINCIEWDPKGNLLASCSDDTTIKIWSMEENTYTHLKSLQGHSSQVHTIKWSLTDANGLFLVSSSYDNIIRIWDVDSGSCAHRLTEHTQEVYSIDVSPNGKLLASGGVDKDVIVWAVESGKLLHVFNLKRHILNVTWSCENRIAAGSADGIIFILTYIHTP